MRLLLISALLLMPIGCSTSSPPVRSFPVPRPATRLESAVETATRSSGFEHALIGILVEDQDGRTLFERNADVLMTPASVRKLFVAAAAAECLGPGRRFDTKVSLEGVQSRSTFSGDLVVQGGGDPSLGGRFDDFRDLRLLTVVEALRSRGITEILGSVVADVSLYDRELLPGTWKLGNIGSTYAAPVDALAFNENVVSVMLNRDSCPEPRATADPSFVAATTDVTCGDQDLVNLSVDQLNVVHVTGEVSASTSPYGDRVAVDNPGLYTAQAFRDLLKRNGIGVTDDVRITASPAPSSQEIASISSPFLFQLLGTVLRNSQNLYAEMLLRNLGGRADGNSIAAGTAREREFLVTTVGLQDNEFSFEDGSGLSPDDMVTPRAVLRLLRFVDAPARKGMFEALLATPGGEGTLRKRLLPLSGRMWGKTGTVARVNALAGLLNGASGRRVRFVILINNHVAPSDDAEVAIDQIVTAIGDL